MGRMACTEPQYRYKGALHLPYFYQHRVVRRGRSKTQFLSVLSPTADVRNVFMKLTSYPYQYVCYPKISKRQSCNVVELLNVIRILFPNLRFTSVDIFMLMEFPSLKFQVMSFVTCHKACEDILQFWLWSIRKFDELSSSTHISDRKLFRGLYQKKWQTPPAWRPGGLLDLDSKECTRVSHMNSWNIVE